MGSIGALEDPTTAGIKRRNSISSMGPCKLDISSMQSGRSGSLPPIGDKDFLTVEFELVSLRPVTSYTSLKDLLPYSPSGVISPTCVSTQSCHDISIRNRLVKQAAWAYLQPMASSTGYSAGPHFFSRIWTHYVIRFFSRHLIPAFKSAVRRLLGVFHFRLHGNG